MTPAQEALVRKAKESLQAARILVEQGYGDFAVSRAYYSMFYVAQAFLLQDGLTFSRHAGVIAAFGQHFAKTKRVPPTYHRYLIEAAASRNIGDYDTGSGVSVDDAIRQIERAEEFIGLAVDTLE